MNTQTLLSPEEIELFNSLEQEAGGDKNKAKQLLCIHQIKGMLEQQEIDLFKNQISNRLDILRFLIKKQDS